MAGTCTAAGPVVLVLLTLAACAARPTGDAARSSAPAESELTVELDRGDGSAVQRWTLTCADSVSGTHPAAREACDHLGGMEDPFAPLPADRVCAQQYGGPQTATVTGRWAGRPVDLALSRVDGCTIAQWDGLGPLLPG
jgi:hypothetical protein